LAKRLTHWRSSRFKGMAKAFGCVGGGVQTSGLDADTVDSAQWFEGVWGHESDTGMT